MNESDSHVARTTNVAFQQRNSLVKAILDAWPAKQDQDVGKRHILLRLYAMKIARYPTSPTSLFTEADRHRKVARQLDAMIEPLRKAVDATDALDEDVYWLCRDGMSEGQVDDLARCTRTLLSHAVAARAAVRLKRGQPAKFGPRMLADLIWQAYVALTGERPRAYRKSYSDQPRTDYESACIEIFGALGLSSADALTAARACCKARKARLLS